VTDVTLEKSSSELNELFQSAITFYIMFNILTRMAVVLDIIVMHKNIWIKQAFSTLFVKIIILAQ
jgi:hypothetical protein